MPIKPLTPYAQNIILKTSFLSDTFNGLSTSNFPLSIHALIADFRSGQMNGFIDDITRHIDLLSSNITSFYSDDCSCVTKDQPTWDMGNPSAVDEPSATGELSHRCPDWSKEPLAYYLPAHNEQPQRYGIHIFLEGIAVVAKTVITESPDLPHKDIVAAALFKLYAHELAHGWIEDLVCLLDKETQDVEPVQNRAYPKTQHRYNSYIYMEEAICNTAAYGWLTHFLHEEEQPQKEGILTAFYDWMKNQPDGYKDFLPIPSAPYLDAKFIENVYYLLTRVYKPNATNPDAWSETLISKTISDYFSGKLSYDGKHWFPRSFFQEYCSWSDNIPVHFECFDADVVLATSLLQKNDTPQPVKFKDVSPSNRDKTPHSTHLTKEQSDWLAKHDIYQYVINDGLVDVNQNVILSELDDTAFPVKFGKVIGDFYLQDCPNLESFENCPQEVIGVFHAHNTQKMIKGSSSLLLERKMADFKTNVPCLMIIQKYCQYTDRHKYIMDCTVDLLDAGFEEAAEQF